MKRFCAYFDEDVAWYDSEYECKDFLINKVLNSCEYDGDNFVPRAKADMIIKINEYTNGYHIFGEYFGIYDMFSILSESSIKDIENGISSISIDAYSIEHNSAPSITITRDIKRTLSENKCFYNEVLRQMKINYTSCFKNFNAKIILDDYINRITNDSISYLVCSLDHMNYAFIESEAFATNVVPVIRKKCFPNKKFMNDMMIKYNISRFFGTIINNNDNDKWKNDVIEFHATNKFKIVNGMLKWGKKNKKNTEARAWDIHNTEDDTFFRNEGSMSFSYMKFDGVIPECDLPGNFMNNELPTSVKWEIANDGLFEKRPCLEIKRKIGSMDIPMIEYVILEKELEDGNKIKSTDIKLLDEMASSFVGKEITIRYYAGGHYSSEALLNAIEGIVYEQ